jgi:hypothetical protein
MNRHPLFVAALLLCAGAGSALAQEIEILDLAALVPGSAIEQTVPPGAVLRVKVINRVPSHSYTLRAAVETIPIVKLEFKAPTARATPTDCNGVIGALLLELKGATTEPQVATFVQKARDDGATFCTSADDKQRLEQQIDALTTHTFRAVVLQMGERLVVEVSRIQGEQTLVWKTLYTTGPRGRWLTTYGVGFLPDEDEEFFTESIGDDQFEIRGKEPNGGLDFVPAIFFTWLPRKWENRSWAFSPAGGLGFDVSSPVVFVGGAAMFNENLSFLAGGVFHKQKRLDGQYQEGQIVNESLAEDQLEVEPYHLNFFFAVAFRFGSNPFGAGE